MKSQTVKSDKQSSNQKSLVEQYEQTLADIEKNIENHLEELSKPYLNEEQRNAIRPGLNKLLLLKKEIIQKIETITNG